MFVLLLILVNAADLQAATGAGYEVMNSVFLPHWLAHCEAGDTLEFPDVVG